MDLVIAGGRGLGLTLVEHHAVATLVAARGLPPVAQQVAQHQAAQGAYAVRLFQHC